MNISNRQAQDWSKLTSALTEALHETRRYNDLRMQLFQIASDPKIIMTDYLRERLMSLATAHHVPGTQT